ncbi:MAG: hypothetical protein AUG46_08930 [Acidobacteria bacterium 13_1_20CM_3_58_11]|nr:MAG: hypothetical protein AUG46_08930 [Acidobacteria bacterium 13_1_20CM_3_58_11]
MDKVKEAPQAKKAGSDDSYKTLHVPSPDGQLHVVLVKALKVVILKDGDLWFAQGLDVDYASQGTSVDDAKQNFENGLAATIHQHLKAYGNLSKFLKPAPPNVWQETLYASLAAEGTSESSKYSQLSIHSVTENDAIKIAKFESIVYYVEMLKVA